MATFYRIVQAEWAASAMTGEGARLFGGRWNPPGVPAVYLADSRALAALEIIVNAPVEVSALVWRIFEVEVPDDLIETVKLSDLPDDWQALPSSPGAKLHGARWLQAGGLCFRLPSTVIPEEFTLLLNPLHGDFSKLNVSEAREFRFDPRFSSRGNHASRPQHCLNFLPEPQGQGALRPVLSIEKLGLRLGRLIWSLGPPSDAAVPMLPELPEEATLFWVSADSPP
jgi:RES domain-containing protein